MFGIHGIAAVREGHFRSLIRDSFVGPSLADNSVPPERLVADLRFVVESQPFSLWEEDLQSDQTEANGVIEGPVMTTADEKSHMMNWLNSARVASAPWLEQVQSNEGGMLDHFVQVMQECQRKNLALGAYFGLLMEYWLKHCPVLGITGLKSSIRVSEGLSTTLGSLKYVWQVDGNRLMHLECSVKFFCRYSDFLVGPHLSETLETRYKFAQRKIAVAKVAKRCLNELYPESRSLVSAAMIQGYVFYGLDKEDGDVGVLFEEMEKGKDSEEGSPVGHLEHLIPNHLARWYSKDFNRASARLSKGLKREEERWSVLPKLYWMSPIDIPDRRKLDFSLPMLDREDMSRLLTMHFNTMPRQRKEYTSRRRRAGLVELSPLLIAQLILCTRADGEKYWVEKSRGFMLPLDWNVLDLIDAENDGGDGVPNEPPQLFVTNASNVVCEEMGVEIDDENNAQNRRSAVKNSEAKSVERKSRQASNCEFCQRFDLSSLLSNYEDIAASEQVILLVKSLFGADTTNERNITLSFTRGFASNQHTQHVVKALAIALQQEGSDPQAISTFALEACIAISDEEKIQIMDKERRSLTRLVLRCCEQACSMKKQLFPQALVCCSKFPDFVRTCVEKKLVGVLHMVLSVGSGANDFPPCQEQVLANIDQDLVKTFIEQLVASVSGWTEIESSVVVGLLRCFQIRLDDSAVEILRQSLISVRKFDLAIEIVSLHPSRELAASLFRDLVVVGRTYRHAELVREKFDLDTMYPYPKLRYKHGFGTYPEETSAMFEDMFSWSSSCDHIDLGGQTFSDREPLQVNYIDSLSSLEDGFQKMKDSKEALSGQPLIVGVDAEWGRESPSSKQSVNESDIIIQTRNSEEELEIPSFLSLWQVFFRDENNGMNVLLLDFAKLLQDGSKLLRQRTLQFMDFIVDGRNTIMVGFGLHEDLRRVKGMFGHVSPTQPVMVVVDAQCVLAAFSAPNYVDGFLGTPYGVSLAKWVSLLLGAELDKSYQCSNWSQRPLDRNQVRYAALDAVAPVLLLNRVLPCFLPETLASWSTTEILSTFS